MNRRLLLLGVGFLGTFSLALPVRAQTPTSRLDAEALSSAAAALVDKGDFAHGCPQYESSARLDPSARRFMKLADCQERAGNIASAWMSFGEARDRAIAGGDKVLAGAARDSVKRLEARLGRIEIVVPPDSAIAGLQIRRDGTLVADAVRGVAVPVDPGSHVISATAPGRRPWSTTIGLSAGKTTVSVVIPSLDQASDAATSREPASPSLASEARPAPGDDLVTPGDDLPRPPLSRDQAALLDRDPYNTTPVEASSVDTELDPQRGSTQRTVGWVLGGAGLASITVGTIFALRAMSTHDTINEMCTAGNACVTAMRDQRDTLRTEAALANVFFWGGMASLAGGAITYFTAPSPQRTEKSTAALQVTPSVAPGGAVLWATGRF